MQSPHLAVLAALSVTLLPLAAQEESETPAEPGFGVLAGLRPREIGPALTSGRVVDIAVDPTDHSHWFVAAASGGVWETNDRGTTWKPVFDGQKSYSIGCVTIDPGDPLTVWVGTGENNSQRSVSYGDGVYKSTDGGRTWNNVGLRDSEHVGKIVVDPVDSRRVFVAAQGPLWSAGGDRGLYLTEDGGESWEKVLEIDEHTGVSDLVMDPRDPDVLLASSYQRRRHTWTLLNGGPGSGIHKSTDGGRTWREVKRGLPGGDLGRIGLAIAPARPDTVYAIVEAARGKGGFYRSVDGGESWQRRSGYVSRSPQYYQELYVDPRDPDRVYSMDTYMQMSEDGGATWDNVGSRSKHVDDHALWIDPDDTRHLVAGCDGGVYESFDRGGSWRFFPNLPITQFYRIAVDDDFPFYNVYGGTQDNFTLGGPSRTAAANGITNRDWFVTLGGDGFEPVVDPEDPDTVYSQYQYGGLVRYDRRTGETVDIKPEAEPDGEPLKWNWNAPLIVSPHHPHRLYFGANFLFRSDDRGSSWSMVSGDLTRGIDRDRLEIMGRTWSVDAVAKHDSTSMYGNSVALAESPLQEGLLWVGTDDGLIHVTRDGGSVWRRIDGVESVPERSYVSALTPSRHHAERVFAAFDDHKRGNFTPYLLRSDDLGRTWTSVAGDLPERGSVHCVVEDHVDPELLFCGTEFGAFFTKDGGEHWHRVRGLPPIAVRDLELQRREDDLAIGTFGRGIWILDDYGPVREATPEMLEQPVAVFSTRPAWRFIERRPLGRGGKAFQGETFFVADNPSDGAVVTYHLRDSLKTRAQRRRERERKARENGEPIPPPSFEELRAEEREQPPETVLTVRDASGEVVRRLTGSTSKGLHRKTWDLRRMAPSGGRGPLVPPGRYTVTVATFVDGEEQHRAGPVDVEVVALPRREPEGDGDDAHAFERRAAELVAVVSAAVDAGRAMDERLQAADRGLQSVPEPSASLADALERLRAELAEVRLELEGDRLKASYDAPTLPSIRDRARNAAGSSRTTQAPTGTQRRSYRLAAAAVEPVLARMRELERALTRLERGIEAAGGPPPRGRVPDWKR